MTFKITLNPNYQGSDPFSVLVCGDKYLLTVNGHDLCWVSDFSEAEKLLYDSGSWAHKLNML